MVVRLLIAAVAVLGIFAGARWAKDRGMPAEPARLEMQAQDLPKTFGDWQGEDVALDPEMFKAIGATMVADRMYRDRGGRAVSLHFAVFDKFPSPAPTSIFHPPEICYAGCGWHPGEPKSVSLDQGQARGDVANLLPLERRGEAAYVLYWYQIDGAAYTVGDRQRSLLLASRGRAGRPPIVKVMLDTSAAKPEQAEKALKSLASEVYKWTKGFK